MHTTISYPILGNLFFATMGEPTTNLPSVVEACRGGAIRLLSDGTVIRSSSPHFLPSVNPIPSSDDSISWKDVQFDPSHGLHLRLYKPRNITGVGPKLPILFYFHGGGFCFGSYTWPAFHNCCLRLARDLNAVVVAPDYRLAPENRLPAALDDAVSALEWIRAQARSPNPDPFLAREADFENVFLSGESAGGNMVHHLLLYMNSAELGPFGWVRGCVLLCPFFGGTQRTESELKYPPGEALLNLAVSDQLWRLALPVGASADHVLSNPSLDDMADLPMMVVVGGLDILRDRDLEYAERLKRLGKNVEVAVFDDQSHGFLPLNLESEAVNELLRSVKKFMDVNGSGRV